jgi:hypothetical protein
VILLALAILCAAPTSAPEPMPDLAPLGLRTQGTLRELFLDLIGTDARPISKASLDLRYAVANDWGIPTAYQRGGTTVLQLLDEQADSLTLSARVPWSTLLGPGPAPIGARPLWERLSSTIELRATLHWGGWSDRPIEAWHGFSGAFNFQRELYPRNQIHVFLGSTDGATAFDVQSSTFALGDAVVRNQLTLWEGGVSAGALAPSGELRPAWAVALRFDFKAPLGSLAKLGGSGGWDGGVAVVGTVEATTWLTLHSLLGLSLTSAWDSAIALQPKTYHSTAELSAVVGLWGWAFFVEDRVVSPLLMPGWDREEAAGNDGYLASPYAADFRAHNQLSFGLRRQGLSVWLSEDFTPGPNPRSNLKWLYNSNAPDVVLGVAYRREL